MDELEGQIENIMGETIQPNDTLEKLQGENGSQPQESSKNVGKTMPINPGKGSVENSYNESDEDVT